MSRVALVVGINKYSFLKNTVTGNYQHLKTPASDAEAIPPVNFVNANSFILDFGRTV